MRDAAPPASIVAVSLLVFLFLSATHASAQVRYSRLEVGGHTSLLAASSSGATDNDFGLGGGFTYNFSKNIALDGQLEFYPRNAPPLPAITASLEGGRRLVGLAGIKAGWRRERFGLFGKARPGIISFGAVSDLNAAGQFDRITHFALDLGGVLEVYPTRRAILRFDVGEMLARYGGRTVSLSPGAFAIAPGYVASFFEVSAGVSYRIGRVRPSPKQEARRGAERKFEVGGQFGWLGIPGSFDSLRDEPGYGGRFTYNLHRWLGLDARVNYFYQNPHTVDFQEGGTILQGFFGPKAGIRGGKVGAFLKFQPGFTSYGQTLSDFRDFLKRPIPFQRLTHFAFDVGAVVEYYPSSRGVVRFDVGDVEVFYGPKTIYLVQGGTALAPGYRKTGLEISTGFGWRF